MNKERHLEIIEDRKQEIEMIESLIRKEDSHNEPVRILEAGCGRRWPFKMEGIQHILTGVDMDKAALEIRKNTLGDLHETVEGDLCSVDLGADRYDVIYCSFVLEHVKRADVVMKNFVKWIKPNGIIIIKIPDPYSVQGYITRITPYWFHVFYYRFILGHKTAGKPGYAPSFFISYVNKTSNRVRGGFFSSPPHTPPCGSAQAVHEDYRAGSPSSVRSIKRLVRLSRKPLSFDE